MEIVLGVIHGKSQVSCAAGTASIVWGHAEGLGCTEVSEEMRLASADLGYNLAG